jgi:hypothetical protein
MLKTLASPAFALYLSLLGGGILWAHADGSARFNRCTDRHSLQYCQLVYLGR